MKVYLIRHGTTDWNAKGVLQGREDIPLNGEGIAQAHYCGEQLKKAGFTYIITSPLIRAYKTAEIIAQHMDIGKPVVDERLTERDFGLLSGKKAEDIFNPNEKGNNMESLDDTALRMIEALKDAAGRNSAEDFAAVSHGGSINAVLRYLSKGEIGSGKTRLKNTCICLLDYDGMNFSILGCNLDASEIRAV
jgi:uncharacterized phosphatase